jgi:hypothetical protein
VRGELRDVFDRNKMGAKLDQNATELSNQAPLRITATASTNPTVAREWLTRSAAGKTPQTAIAQTILKFLTRKSGYVTMQEPRRVVLLIRISATTVKIHTNRNGNTLPRETMGQATHSTEEICATDLWTGKKLHADVPTASLLRRKER